ncbi:MAG: helix-hairpin-helix domain-containing protein [Verrucomicrobiota bacterium]|nr:helix-hairpin-helix domain-containing protein [Verrucomicrobiota bacterium]
MTRKLVLVCTFALLLVGRPALAHGPWVVLPNCHLVPNKSNDGDSFHVSAAGREYVFRLYFVDAPETDESFPERVADQAKYFGVTSAQATQVGDLAKHFTNGRLARAFTVRTCMQDALGRSAQGRFYAFIGTDEGDLGELLVANGLARVHGTAGQPVGLASPHVEWQKLERLEREAKSQKVGGWGATSGRMTARLPTAPTRSGADSFDAWFHPEKLASRTEATTIAGPTPTPFGVQGAWPFAKPGATPAPVAKPNASASSAHAANEKLDPNAASSSELIAIRGIGPVLAARIIEARPFESADDLRKVKGIGPKKYEQLRPFFR